MEMHHHLVFSALFSTSPESQVCFDGKKAYSLGDVISRDSKNFSCSLNNDGTASWVQIVNSPENIPAASQVIISGEAK